jgi:hypothetical protein
MWKVFLAGVGAIALLVVGSVAVVVLVTGDDPPRGAAARQAASAPAAPAGQGISREGLPPPPTALTYGTPPPAEAPPRPVSARAPAPPAGSWEAVPVTARAKSLGRLGGAVAAQLMEFRDQLTTCFTYEAQARLGSGAVTHVQDASPMDDHGSIVLVLQLEGQQGGFRIVDAPVETRGPAGDELLACAQSVLRGKVLAVPGAQPGQKVRLLHQLVP